MLPACDCREAAREQGFCNFGGLGTSHMILDKMGGYIETQMDQVRLDEMGVAVRER